MSLLCGSLWEVKLPPAEVHAAHGHSFAEHLQDQSDAREDRLTPTLPLLPACLGGRPTSLVTDGHWMSGPGRQQGRTAVKVEVAKEEGEVVSWKRETRACFWRTKGPIWVRERRAFVLFPASTAGPQGASPGGWWVWGR